MGFVETGAVVTGMPASRPFTKAPPPFRRIDLVGRKMAREGGVTAKTLDCNHACLCSRAWRQAMPISKASHKRLVDGIDAVERAVDYNLANFNHNIRASFAGSVPMVKLFGIVCGGWQLLSSRSRQSSGQRTPA